MSFLRYSPFFLKEYARLVFGMRQSDLTHVRFSLFRTVCFISVRVSVRVYIIRLLCMRLRVSTCVYVGLCGLIRAVRACMCLRVSLWANSCCSCMYVSTRVYARLRGTLWADSCCSCMNRDNFMEF
jgi:hypothetical protein